MYNLFLDDLRNPPDVTWILYPSNITWIIVRSYDQFVDVIKKNGLPSIISFDHDLGDEHYKEFFKANDEHRNIQYDNFTEKTGYECAKYIANYCVENKLHIPLYYIHSMNGIGAQNIYSILESARKML